MISDPATLAGAAAVQGAAKIERETKRTTPAKALVDAFVLALRDGRWHTARQLADATGLPDRVARMCAEASEGRVISGQQGYKLTACATPGEIHHACAWLLSQAARMTDRARQIRLAQHRAPAREALSTKLLNTNGCGGQASNGSNPAKDKCAAPTPQPEISEP